MRRHLSSLLGGFVAALLILGLHGAGIGYVGGGATASAGWNWIPDAALERDNVTDEIAGSIALGEGTTSALVDFTKDDSAAGECTNATEALVVFDLRDATGAPSPGSWHLDSAPLESGVFTPVAPVVFTNTGANLSSHERPVRAVVQLAGDGTAWFQYADNFTNLTSSWTLLACR